MEKLANISAFTNLMNQSNSAPVQNGFMDKAKKAIYPALVGGSLLGGGLVGQRMGYDKGYNDSYADSKARIDIRSAAEYANGYRNGWDDQEEANSLFRGWGYSGTGLRASDLSEGLDTLERLLKPSKDGIYSQDPDERKFGKKRIRTLLYTLERFKNSMTPDEQGRFDQLKQEVQGTGLVEAFDYGADEIADIVGHSHPLYNPNRDK